MLNVLNLFLEKADFIFDHGNCVKLTNQEFDLLGELLDITVNCKDKNILSNDEELSHHVNQLLLKLNKNIVFKLNDYCTIIYFKEKTFQEILSSHNILHIDFNHVNLKIYTYKENKIKNLYEESLITNDIPTAEEVRKMMIKDINLSYINELMEVKYLINRAIQNKVPKVYLNKRLSQDTIEILINKGYSIKINKDNTLIYFE